MFTNERLFTIQAFTITRVHCTYLVAHRSKQGIPLLRSRIISSCTQNQASKFFVFSCFLCCFFVAQIHNLSLLNYPFKSAKIGIDFIKYTLQYGNIRNHVPDCFSNFPFFQYSGFLASEGRF